MDDRRGRRDAMGQRPFASAAQGQERVFDGGGGGGGGGPGPAFGGEFDQGSSSLMALLGAGGAVSSQPPPPTWGVEEVTAAPAINLVPQSLFSMVNSVSLIYILSSQFDACVFIASQSSSSLNLSSFYRRICVHLTITVYFYCYLGPITTIRTMSSVRCS
jgi:hypothetical protein